MTDNNTHPPDPTAIMQLATAYWASAALLSANDLGVFDALAEKPRTAEECAEATATDPCAVAMLLDACAALNLVGKEGDTYHLPPAPALYLSSHSPASLHDALRWARDQYAVWGKLADAVREGKPAAPPEDHLGRDAAQTRTFVLAMHQRAQGVARGVVPFLNLSGAKTLLDVGAGPGTYAMLLARKYPELHVTARDLPAVVAVADELIAHSGLSDRIRTLPGDATDGDYGTAQYDAVLFSGVLHQMDAATIQTMLRGAYRALRPGGRVLLSDMMLDDTRTAPVFSTLFSLQMLLTSERGACFAVADARRWLEAAGFTGVADQTLPPPLPYTVVTAQKPEYVPSPTRPA